MQKKNKNSNQKTNENVNVNENKKKDNDEGEKKKQEANPISPAVLKIDMHCEGCASKIIRCVRGFEGIISLRLSRTINLFRFLVKKFCKFFINFFLFFHDAGK